MKGSDLCVVSLEVNKVEEVFWGLHVPLLPDKYTQSWINTSKSRKHEVKLQDDLQRTSETKSCCRIVRNVMDPMKETIYEHIFCCFCQYPPHSLILVIPIDLQDSLMFSHFCFLSSGRAQRCTENAQIILIILCFRGISIIDCYICG